MLSNSIFVKFCVKFVLINLIIYQLFAAILDSNGIVIGGLLTYILLLRRIRENGTQKNKQQHNLESNVLGCHIPVIHVTKTRCILNGAVWKSATLKIVS